MIKGFVLIGSLLFSLAAASTLSAQNFLQDLNGFRLGQYRAVTYRQFGEPWQRGANSEDVVYDAFLLKEEPVLYMVFQYQTSAPDVIWSIQITGSDDKHDPGFKGLRFGMAPNEVEKLLGKPSKTIDVGEHGTRWEFEGRNYSIEIDPKNKLSSIRIVEERSKEPDMKNLPKFGEVVKKLQTGTNTELADFLAPDMVVFEGGQALAFEAPIRSEVEQDRSKVFAAIRRLSKELSSVDTGKPDQYQELMRLMNAREPQHVVRLHKLKGVQEIVFRWNGERWQIWEFGSGKPTAPPPQDWKSIYKPGSLKDLVSVRIPELIKTPNVAMTKDDGKPLASFSYNSYPTSTKVKFTGESRKTPESTLTLISLWLETLGKSKELAKRFENEYKFVENGVEYWLPVQIPLPERLPKEVKTNGEITIYLSWIGIQFVNDKPELLAIVNEFTAVE